MKRTNRITEQTAPPTKVLGVDVPRERKSTLSDFDQARVNHGPHVKGPGGTPPGPK